MFYFSSSSFELQSLENLKESNEGLIFFELLTFLCKNTNKVHSRNKLLDLVWGYDFLGDTRTVDVHIRYLRKKIETDEEKYIETIRGIGYKLDL